MATAGQNEVILMNNIKIRQALASKMMKYYQLDELLGISEATRCRMLRTELPAEEQNRIIQLIEEKAGEQHGNNDQ